MSFLSGPVARCRQSRIESASLQTGPVSLAKNPTPTALVTPVSTAPRLSYTPEPQKNLSHIAKTTVTTAAELQPISAANREIEIAGLLSCCRLRQEAIEEKRHELLLRGLISQ